MTDKDEWTKDNWKVDVTDYPIGTMTIDNPTYYCGTHGEHLAWVQFTIGDEQTPIFCLKCIIDFLKRQSIGQVSGEYGKR